MTGARVAGRPRVRGRLEPGTSRKGPWVVAGCVVAGAFLTVVVGGYALHWRWTGLSRSVTLWDWLQVLVLPVAVAAAPILVHHRHTMRGRHKRAMAAGALAFGALVLAGYLVPMAWTGFTGNTLWDWLELLLLPVVIATGSLWATSWPLARSHVAIVVGATAAVAVLALLGYTVPWRWTGFSGNTAWDWIKLLLLPVMVPLVLVPSVAKYLSEEFGRPTAESAPTARASTN